jgi:putative polyketide hydroxylase
MAHRGAKVSTIDLFGDRWVLVSGPRGRAWSELLRQSPAARAFGIAWHGIHPDGDLEDLANRWSTAYGVHKDGAVLIRPDGFIAWRRPTSTGNAAAAFNVALERLQMRTVRETVTRASREVSS